MWFNEEQLVEWSPKLAALVVEDVDEECMLFVSCRGRVVPCPERHGWDRVRVRVFAAVRCLFLTVTPSSPPTLTIESGGRWLHG